MIGEKYYTVKEEPKKEPEPGSVLTSWLFLVAIFLIIFGPKIIEAIPESPNKSHDTTIKEESVNDIEKVVEYMKEYEGYKVFGSYGLKIIDSGYNDKEGLLGIKNQYLAKAVVSCRIDGYINDDNGFVIELFDNVDDLEARVAYIEAKNSYLDKVYGEDYGMFLPGMAEVTIADAAFPESLPMKQDIYTYDNALLCINSIISEDIQEDISSSFKKAVKNLNYCGKKEPDPKKVRQNIADNEKFLKVWKEKYSKDKLISAIDSLKNEMIKQVNCTYAMGDKKLIDETLEDIEPFDTKKYQKEYQEWKNLLTDAKKNVAKGEISKEMLAKQEEYKKIVYSEGKYVVGKDIMPGIYQVIANDEADKSSVYFDYKYSYEIYGNTYINITDIKDSNGYYNDISVTGATMYHIDNASLLEFKIPGVYKVGRDIEAGEYLVQADSYIKYYVATDPKYLNKEKISEMKDSSNKQYLKDESNYGYLEAGPDEQMVTLKDGEYLYIADERIKLRKK